MSSEAPLQLFFARSLLGRGVLWTVHRTQSLWGAIADLAHGLFVAFVPAASVAAGFLFYWASPPAQDLFLEVSGSRTEAMTLWSKFYALAIFAWAVPVYYSARWILAHRRVLAAGRPKLHPLKPWVEAAVPPLLAALCFVAIMLGQWKAIVDSPRTDFASVSLDGAA